MTVGNTLAFYNMATIITIVSGDRDIPQEWKRQGLLLKNLKY
jgi:hypothetical protein